MSLEIPRLGPASDRSGQLNLLREARKIYRAYFAAHPDSEQRPVGVALNRRSGRGDVVFGRRPILLPQEFFVPLDQLQADA
ncbi:hypothetical protein syc2158_d [Synechococcus elongatus PCC 6301]|uniref:Uncharacterized protein n=1 Tax=Synechococcus sp. (strain ATCC 27144 / PCC 6301 / SAUG 1402/1) TaxID=269084 RepID=A0A0H3K8F2_SYNP6|nr:hypothetical protein [Synechococcus elongatus]BAD80348.1 hypothetical protein syc2158_d [Synechococcus elongatus PCC 6301]